MRVSDFALAAGLIVTLTIMGTLAWRAAQQGALPRLHPTYEAAR